MDINALVSRLNEVLEGHLWPKFQNINYDFDCSPEEGAGVYVEGWDGPVEILVLKKERGAAYIAPGFKYRQMAVQLGGRIVFLKLEHGVFSVCETLRVNPGELMFGYDGETIVTNKRKIVLDGGLDGRHLYIKRCTRYPKKGPAAK